jgi:hypothetical protein
MLEEALENRDSVILKKERVIHQLNSQLKELLDEFRTEKTRLEGDLAKSRSEVTKLSQLNRILDQHISRFSAENQELKNQLQNAKNPPPPAAAVQNMSKSHVITLAGENPEVEEGKGADSGVSRHNPKIKEILQKYIQLSSPRSSQIRIKAARSRSQPYHNVRYS